MLLQPAGRSRVSVNNPCKTFGLMARVYRKYESGAVGTMLHATALHGKDYAIELEVYADGVSHHFYFLSFGSS